MKTFFLVSLACLTACSQPSEENSSSSSNPKSMYGQSVKKARDLQAPSQAEEETKRQAKELLDDQ